MLWYNHTMKAPQTKICKTCKSLFTKALTCSSERWKLRKFCSRSCINKGRTGWRKGKKFAYKPNLKLRGKTTWNKGKTGYNPNEENGMWKGSKASLPAKHAWVVRRLGKPSNCELCGTTEKRMYHWANISGNYLRDVSDYMRLCVPCHKRYDLEKINNKKDPR